MPLALIAIGVVFLTAGVRGKQDDLFALLKDDFTGRQNFLVWMTALGVIGAVGYIPRVAPVSRAMLALILIVLVISNRGFFSQFRSAVLSNQSGI